MKNTKKEKALQELKDLHSCICKMTPDNFTTSFGEYVNRVSTLSSKEFKKILKKIDRSDILNQLILDAGNQISEFVKRPLNPLEDGHHSSPLTFDGTQVTKFIIYPNSFNSMIYPDTFEFMKNRDDGGPSHYLKYTNDIINKVRGFWTEEHLYTLNHIV